MQSSKYSKPTPGMAAALLTAAETARQTQADGSAGVCRDPDEEAHWAAMLQFLDAWCRRPDRPSGALNHPHEDHIVMRAGAPAYPRRHCLDRLRPSTPVRGIRY